MNENPPQKVESREEEPVEIKRITPDDWQLYRDLRVESLKADPDSFEKDDEAIREAENLNENYWRDLITGTVENKFFLYGILINGQIVATASLSTEEDDGYNLSYDSQGKRPTIDRVFVKKEYRGGGREFGKKVMEKVIDAAINELKVDCVFLDVNVKKLAAIGFYGKLGFKFTGKSISILYPDLGPTLNTDGSKKIFSEMRLNLSRYSELKAVKKSLL